MLATQMAHTGVQRAFGASLRSLLSLTLRGRLAAFFGGLGVTAVLPSSTIASSMTAEFTRQGIVELPAALAVVLGANVGATLAVQALSFNIPAISPALILIGVMMFRKASNTRAHDLGSTLIGLGLLLLAVDHLQELMTDYDDAPNLRMLLGAASTVPAVDVLLAAGLAWAADSNVAMVLLVATLCAKNVVPPNTAFALVMGANLGAAINPVLDATAAHDPVSRRLPVGNLIIVIVGAAAALAVLTPIGCVMVRMEPDNGRVVADFYTLFNLVLASLFFPLLTPYASLLSRLLPPLAKFADAAPPRDMNPLATGSLSQSTNSASSPALRAKETLGTVLSGPRSACAERRGTQAPVALPRGDVLEMLVPEWRNHSTVVDAARLTESDRRSSDEQTRIFPLQIRECANHSIQLVDPDGNAWMYYPARSLWLTLQDIKLIRQLEPSGNPERSIVSTCVRGTACLDDCELSIIGQPQKSTRTVLISFAAREIATADRLALREWQDDMGISLSDEPLGVARLGFNASEAETEEVDQWWVECHIPESSMQALADGIEEGRITAVRLAVFLHGLYTTAASGIGEPSIFLRPMQDDQDAESPVIAPGYVVHLAFDLSTLDLRPDDEEKRPRPGRSPGTPSIASSADAVAPLAARLDRLVNNLKWLAALIAVLVLVFAIKGR
ncbi:Na/Pi symporter [Trinickia symbiotica]|nr:Na/Pi symporter [Trinickia symbiotica]